MEQKQGGKEAYLYEVDGYKILFARDAYSGEVKILVGQGENLVMVDRLPYMLLDSEERRQKFVHEQGRHWVAKYEAGQPEETRRVYP